MQLTGPPLNPTILKTLNLPVWLQEVTKQQAKERAAERKLRGQPTLDAFIKQPPAAGTKPFAAPQKRKRTVLKRAFTSLDDEGELLSRFQL